MRIVIAAVAGMALSTAAHAQLLDQLIPLDIPGLSTEPTVTVTSRVRPDYAAPGVRLGGLMIRPLVTQGLGYDDNVTGTSQGRGSAVSRTRAQVEAATDLSRYGAGAQLSVDDTRFLDAPRQSTRNWTASAGGYYRFGRDAATLAVSHVDQAQSPRDLDTPQLESPIQYRVDTITAGYRTTFNRLSLRPELSVSRYDFDDGVVAGAPFRQKFRNRTVTAPGLVATYELAPRRTLVVSVRNLTASYSNRTAGSPRRDFNDTAFLSGVDFDGGGPWRLRLLAGYEVRSFAAAEFKTISAPIVEATVIYTPTGLTTVTGRVARRIQDSSDETTTGFTETAFTAILDHEYLRNVLLRAQGGVTMNDYKQGGARQTLYSGGLGATWLLNRTMRLGATYDYVTRRSGAAAATQGARLGGPFSESRTMLQLTLGL